MANEFWLNDRQWSAIEPSAAAQSTGSASGRRPTGDQRHCSCAESGLPMGGLPCALRAVDDGLQSLQPVVSTRALAAPVRRPGNNRCGRHADHRQHDGQGPSLCRGRKRGALAQAIGRSRGGRTTKIHAVVDCLGRLIAFEITPGQLGDVRVAGSLLAPMPAARLCIADTAYDSNGLRQFLSERGTQPVIPNNPTRKRFHPFDADIYKQPQSHRAHVLSAQGLAPHRHSLRQAGRQLRSRRRHRYHRPVVDLIKSGT